MNAFTLTSRLSVAHAAVLLGSFLFVLYGDRAGWRPLDRIHPFYVYAWGGCSASLAAVVRHRSLVQWGPTLAGSWGTRRWDDPLGFPSPPNARPVFVDALDGLEALPSKCSNTRLVVISREQSPSAAKSLTTRCSERAMALASFIPIHACSARARR